MLLFQEFVLVCLPISLSVAQLHVLYEVKHRGDANQSFQLEKVVNRSLFHCSVFHCAQAQAPPQTSETFVQLFCKRCWGKMAVSNNPVQGLLHFASHFATEPEETLKGLAGF